MPTWTTAAGLLTITFSPHTRTWGAHGFRFAGVGAANTTTNEQYQGKSGYLLANRRGRLRHLLHRAVRPMRVPMLAGSLSLIVMSSAVSAQTTSSAQFRDLFAQYFDTCMKDWDAATHMTKGEWSRTCRRLAEERVKFRLEHGEEVKPRQK
jgi:hypothetical protein